MRYVLDSSVAFKWVVPESDSDKAILLRDETRQGSHELLAPDVFPIEIAHALTRAERQGRVSAADGWTLAGRDDRLSDVATLPHSDATSLRPFLRAADRRL
jgi:predicted nucleic acid-binding protein